MLNAPQIEIEVKNTRGTITEPAFLCTQLRQQVFVSVLQVHI
jgi:hypothetical protein